ncbi:MAG: hypothetical protein QY322_01600 [bacterium]|nr:MAG: hypothetical protein QY322_01600 [bacterium]
MKKIVPIVSKYIPFIIKKVIGKFVNIPIAHKTVFQHYKSRYGKVRLLLNNGDSRQGYLTVGFSYKCDIQVDSNKPIRLYFDDSSVDEILVEYFLEEIQDQTVYEDFLGECNRIINNSSDLKVLFLDSKIALSKIGGKLEQKDWVTKKRYLQSSFVTRLNTLFLNSNNEIKRFIDHETLKILLNKNGFKVDSTQILSRDGNSLIYCKKNIHKSRLLNLAGLLPVEKNDKADFPVYFFNCDSIQILNNFEDIDKEKVSNRKFASVIGSLFFLNIIPHIKPKEILLFDINDYQVRYLKLLVEIMSISKTFENFIENLFVRRYNANNEIFLRQEYDPKIYKKLVNVVSDREIFYKTIKKIAFAKYLKLNNELPTLIIDNNSMCQSITILNEEMFKPGPAVNVVYRNSEFAKNYGYVKNVLINSKIKTATIVDEKVVGFVKDGGVLYTSNIGEEDWLNDSYADHSLSEVENTIIPKHIISSFRKQWIDGFIGFNDFIKKVSGHFWLVDSQGNIFNSQKLLIERSDSHQWLWGEVKPLLIGNTVEIIHKKEGTWGFHEHLRTVNYDKYIKTKGIGDTETVIMHILLGNGVSFKSFVKVLERASLSSKRIVVLEHDRDSINFGKYSSQNIVDIRTLVKLIRSVKALEDSKINITWSGASTRIDKNKYGNAANYNRNVLVTIDL